MFCGKLPPGWQVRCSGRNHLNQTVSLSAISLNQCGNVQHGYRDVASAYDFGAMNGFDQLKITCNVKTAVSPFSYVTPYEIEPYYYYASHFASSDATVQPDKSSVAPAYLELISGQSGEYETGLAFSDNTLGTFDAWCPLPSGSLMPQIDMSASYPATPLLGQFPCLTIPTIFSELDAKNVGWRYYVNQLDSRENVPFAITSIYNGPDAAKVISPETTVLTDIAGGMLRPVSFVTASRTNSDNAFEAANRIGGGPQWVQSIVSAFRSSKYWSSGAIILTYVNSGNWYDDYAPPFAQNPFGGSPNPLYYGFRVPFIVISPYARLGYVDHTPRSTMSILRFLEANFGVPSLGTMDVYEPDDLSQMFYGSGLGGMR